MLDVRLHGGLWRSVQAARRDEWVTSLDELNGGNTLALVDVADADEPAMEIVRLPSGAFHLRTYADAFERVGEVTLDSERLEALFADYSTTIRQMVHVDGDAPARGFEALDYAKRVVHDEAGEFVVQALAPIVQCGKEDARRLFTLLFLIGGDLPANLVRYHRFH